MSHIFTFHKSVIGQGHIDRDKPCEDSSASYTSEDGRYHIAIIADGHGQEKSFRSKIGSQAAADVALECLKGFAESYLSTPETEERFYQDIFDNPRYRQVAMRLLTDSILAGWSDRIQEDYAANPPTAQELGEYAEYFQKESRRQEIYGTTLIAALRLPKCLLLLQQGDGRCDVFYADGSVDQPIPWDPRCEGNQTTSMCDDDSADSFRHCIIDLTKKQVVACYAGSDGVEDAYRDPETQEGTHTFYRDLSCMLIEMGTEAFDGYLEEMLPVFSAAGRFSKTGSRDDVSVSGIVDLDALALLVPAYRTAVERYDLSEKLFWREDDLRSKTRSHGIRKKRMEEAGQKARQAETVLVQLHAQRDSLRQRLDAINARIEQSQAEIEADRAGYEKFRRYYNGEEPQEEDWKEAMRFIRSKCAQSLQKFLTDTAALFSDQESQHAHMLKQKKELTEHLQAKEEEILKAVQECQLLAGQAAQLQAEFEEYDAKYQAIARQIQVLQDQIDSLNAAPVMIPIPLPRQEEATAPEEEATPAEEAAAPEEEATPAEEADTPAEEATPVEEAALPAEEALLPEEPVQDTDLPEEA